MALSVKFFVVYCGKHLWLLGTSLNWGKASVAWDSHGATFLGTLF